MVVKRVRAKTAKSARRKARTKTMVPTKVNYIKGSKKKSKKGLGTYSVTIKGKKGVKSKARKTRRVRRRNKSYSNIRGL